jgi:hypothetical protein
MNNRSSLVIFLYIVFLLVAIIAAWLIIVGVVSPFSIPSSSVGDWKTFLSAATLFVTSVSAIMAAALSIHNLYAQANISKELEFAKADISKDLEKVKQILVKDVQAHGDLYAAAMRYYRALAPLEMGDFNINDIRAAEAKMDEVEGLTVYVDDDYEAAWWEFWQSVRTLQADVHRNIHKKDDRVECWHQNVKNLGDKVHRLKDITRKRFA